ncbi:DUF3885 domain-containing protein [Priestia flexa]|jgi:Domain of unknown function (DUF3885)|uniref:DUF3885 domain-containing protein n=2 Tax=Priestia TaxID=2800373 RepID=A0A0V8JIQ5_9BACI|nr:MULTISPECIES: DUF3885 domain-containing protein [Bacillaceae]AQX54265.1 hypothetical protein BC359_08060 [Priestia flexa]KSU86915.1 hypothetical protein AS180_15935 [Priestia veravalensis]KZB90806.1 hypothetical protein A2U94_14100 [Bacillus sp. VT 712]MBN8434848.1 DUF3885 domain-containing protein [Priestia flexa]MBY6087266.1 DUF3885 domain-containing protein [Priestia flexa]
MNNLTLQSYLSHLFPDIQMRKPLFYNAPIGIRFKLTNQKRVWEQGYMKNVYKRTYQIFKALHDENDELIVVFRSPSSKAELSFLKRTDILMKKFIRSRLRKTSVQLLSTKNEYAIACRPTDLKQKQLLQSIANRDLHIQPAIEEECYIINVSKGTIFHLYDDRALDVVSNNQRSLGLLQEKFNEWILDMDATEHSPIS